MKGIITDMRIEHDDIHSSKVIKEFVLNAGATVVGIAPASAFNKAPIGHKATDIIPDAKSVIVFGIKLVSGAVNWPELVWKRSRQTIIDSWRVYDQCCFDSVNMKLEQIGMDLAIAFEVENSQSIFFPGSTDMTVEEINSPRFFGDMDFPQILDQEKLDRIGDSADEDVSDTFHKRYSGVFSFRHAAVAAGLATLGANNLALHPVFGPRIRFNVVITDCKIDHYDQPLNEPVCLYDNGCRICISTCPYHVFQHLKRFEFAGLSHPLCKMEGNCYYNSYACGGTCLQVCPAGTGDKQLKKSVIKRLSDICLRENISDH